MSEDKRTIGWKNWNSNFKRKKPTATLSITLELFNYGKNIEDIMRIRQFKRDSVERQIIELITMGHIFVDDVIGTEKREKIQESINEENIDKLSDIKEIVGEDFSYFEIKCTIAHINSS